MDGVAGGAPEMEEPPKEDVPLHDEFLLCGGIVTHVLKCGPWSDLFNTEDPKAPKLLILIIPGNPGIPAFYAEFLKALYLSLEKRYPVWAISHAGHISAPSGARVREESPEDPSSKTPDDAFGLEGQVEHKLAFLRKCVPSSLRLVIISHSVGSYILLEMMKRGPQLPVLRSLLLFPTIGAGGPRQDAAGRLGAAEAEDGETVTGRQNFANMAACEWRGPSRDQEMKVIVERDNATIQKHLKKLIFYYGKSDLWCPVQYYEDLKKDFPGGDIKLCEKGIQHAFVLSSNQEMAALIADWLRDDLSKL
ncbi:lipid droplet-associated hydrolase [Sarcophilus harrisii]|uniref:lipid droplet-associated hydrolase n=1 Tax=Sarcophilus harrisii TaxID=9305 RepID=UPI001301D1A5|nr:lipid droplet-associated hydrolase [Sarcophilus harrisii]